MHGRMALVSLACLRGSELRKKSFDMNQGVHEEKADV